MAAINNSELGRILQSLETRIPRIVLRRIEMLFPALNEIENITKTVSVYLHNTRYSCDVCKRSFRYDSQRTAHKEKYHDVQVCRVCGKSFINSPVLSRHMQLHESIKERPFVCDICNKTFTKNCDFKEHYRIHSGEKRFLCDICGRSFIQKYSLKEHIMRVHSGERPYECHLCKHLFISVSALKLHIRVHTGDRDFTCDICNRKFRRRYHLQCHMRTHFS